MRSFVSLVQKTLPSNKLNLFGKGGWLMTSLPYYLMTLFTCFAYLTMWDNAWIMIVVTYVLLPFLDQLLTLDEANPTETQRRELQKSNFYFELCLYSIVAIDWFLFFQIMSYFKSFEFTFHGCYNLIALVFAFSNLNAVQFAVAHEMFHKQGFCKFLGIFHTSKNLYLHFIYQHIYGHHRTVGTPEDCTSAEQGMTIYQFIPRSVFGAYQNVFKMQRDQDNKPFYLNYAVLSVAGAFAFTAAIYYFYGMQTTILFLIEVFGSICYAEATNYIEHYGLRREKLPNGQYEKVTIRHSWNSPHRITNYILFKVQRHSDHHQNSLKPYQTLLSVNQSPQLPHGYSLMIFMSFFPSTWFSIIDPLVQEYKKHGAGTILNQVTLKSKQATRQFIVSIAPAMIGLCIMGWVI